MEEPFNRRDFARKLAAGAFAAGSGIAAAQDRVNPDNRPKPRGSRANPDKLNPSADGKHSRTAGRLSTDGSVFAEDAREIPVRADFDAIVCGGGPAGFAAALAAARAGAKTAVIENNGCLGGVWTSGLLSWILDARNKPGIMAELIAKLSASQTGRIMGGAFVYHPDEMKMALEQMLLEAGVRVRIHTRVVGAVADESNRLAAILTESKSGREAWTARSFIDATGDGDLAAQAGCGFDFGRPQDGVTQPFSMIGLFTGCTTDGIAPFVREIAEPRGLGRAKPNLLAEMRKAGVDPSYGGPTIFRIREGLFCLMANHQYNVSAIDADDVSRATLEARHEVHHLIGSLRKLGGAWKNVELVTTAEQIGTREGRRIHGRYTVSDNDLRTGARFEDSICRVTFPIDVHATDPNKTKEIEAKPFRSQAYDIPLRALFAKDVDGLMVAGRCISGDFIAHSSYRVTGNAVAMGEAAGATSALAVANRVLPHEVPFGEVKSKLAAEVTG